MAFFGPDKWQRAWPTDAVFMKVTKMSTNYHFNRAFVVWLVTHWRMIHNSQEHCWTKKNLLFYVTNRHFYLLYEIIPLILFQIWIYSKKWWPVQDDPTSPQEADGQLCDCSCTGRFPQASTVVKVHIYL